MKGWTNNLVHNSLLEFLLMLTWLTHKLCKKLRIKLSLYISTVVVCEFLWVLALTWPPYTAGTWSMSVIQSLVPLPKQIVDNLSIRTQYLSIHLMSTRWELCGLQNNTYSSNYLYLVLMTHSQIKYFPLKVKYIWMFMFFFLSRLSALIIINKAGVEIHLF